MLEARLNILCLCVTKTSHPHRINVFSSGLVLSPPEMLIGSMEGSSNSVGETPTGETMTTDSSLCLLKRVNEEEDEIASMRRRISFYKFLKSGKDFTSEVLEEIKPTLVDILGAIIIFKNLLNEMVGADFDMDKSCRYISVKDLTGTSIWVSSSDGDKVYSSIKRAFDKDEHVVLSFERCSENIDAACFFSAAIGSLYGDFPDEKVNSLLHICDADDELMRTLKLAVENAKKYYANKDAYDEAW